MKKAIPLLFAVLCLLALSGCGSLLSSMTPNPSSTSIPRKRPPSMSSWTIPASSTTTYPAYGDGWTVTAHPDGTLTDPATGREYYCLFWEGVSPVEYDFSEGFVVPGKETAAFLEEALATLGLTDQEANEFLIYWLPKVEGNPYNLIAFQDEVYTENAALSISPCPLTLCFGSSWPGRGWRSRWKFRPKFSLPRLALGSPWWSGAEPKCSDPLY